MYPLHPRSPDLHHEHFSKLFQNVRIRYAWRFLLLVSQHHMTVDIIASFSNLARHVCALDR